MNSCLLQFTPLPCGCLAWLRALAIACVTVFSHGCGAPAERVVLYCAQDEEYAQAICTRFQQATSTPVHVKYDTESTKSVSLVAELVAEKRRPRCDVHWNNEILGTIRLARDGILEPYRSPQAEAFPASTRPDSGMWQAFAARARIILVNTKLVPEAQRPRSILELTEPKWRGKVAIAKPQFGTTATEAACLFEVMGTDKAQAYYRGLRDNEVQIVSGNKQVADGVGNGMFPLGMTDTDDAIEEVKAGKPVALIFPDRNAPESSRMGTLFIPNTAALIKGAPSPEGGKKLIDYLLSPETEKFLATHGSHQIPLNPNVKAELPPQIETPRTVKAMRVDFEKAADLWDEVQSFLRSEFARAR